MKKYFPYILLIIFSAKLFAQKEIESYDWENEQVIGINKTPPHVETMPYADIEQALKSDIETSPYYKSLNGKWKFRFSENPFTVPENFYIPSYDVSGWKYIAVLSDWQTEGYDFPIYANQPYSWTRHPHPPHVPHKYNPTGLYRTTFTVPTKNYILEITIKPYIKGTDEFDLWNNVY